MIARLVIATHNRKKAGEMMTILSERFPSLELLTLADIEGAPEPEETGSTYSENAAIKAQSAFDFTGDWCVADDAGLEIDALDGAPGLYSKRFGGEDLPFPEKMAKILHLLEDADTRAARFRCNVALVGPNHPVKVFEAICEGEIAAEPSGNGGFGYDPIFYLPQLDCCMADLTAQQKHQVSHRGKVLKQFGDYLASI
ncbi:MAG: RdgB/HAM1 family non-canonical purine NTP pyrophosphatase [Armatimonadetes bacterium]|nr:RdgB/HAM1 family non-canonical purine NTP pyrophosphatase [Armatimonadota bacterium]MBS1728364.1 RdgB/HAM1 family non-canonical purine NTP pyrophosphatase [Armatimonadota bacterium]